MWESLAAFRRDFSKQLWESALFADFHSCGISIRPGSGTVALVFRCSVMMAVILGRSLRKTVVYRPVEARSGVGPYLTIPFFAPPWAV